MITTDFAPNESGDDSRKAFQVLLNPLSWTKGKSIEKVKANLKRSFFPTSSIHLFLSGRGALYYLLKTLNIPDKSEVLVQAFTCEAVVLPIMAHGYTPVYVDINETDFSMNPVDLTKKYTENSKVIILQHTFGILPGKRQEIITFAKKNKLVVIEDLAHGFSPKQLDKDKNKTIKLLSFGRSKAFSSVFGGAVVLEDKNISASLKSIEDKLAFPKPFFIFQTLFYKVITPLIKSTYNIFLGKIIHKAVVVLGLMSHEISSKEKSGQFDHNMAFAYPNGLATVLLHQLKKYKKISALRARNVSTYSDVFNKSIGNNPLIRFPVLVDNRFQLIRAAAKQKITLGKWYDQVVAPKAIPLHKVQYKKNSCPKAEEISERVVNLPTSLTAAQTEKVTDIVKQFIDNHGNPGNNK